MNGIICPNNGMEPDVRENRSITRANLYMSLIRKCELCGANPSDYLRILWQNSVAVAGQPASWMPWNYNHTLVEIKS